VVGARVLEKNLELADGVYRLAARTLPLAADTEVTTLRWRDECWGVGQLVWKELVHWEEIGVVKLRGHEMFYLYCGPVCWDRSYEYLNTRIVNNQKEA